MFKLSTSLGMSKEVCRRNSDETDHGCSAWEEARRAWSRAEGNGEQSDLGLRRS